MSEHFSYDELTASETARALGIPNVPDVTAADNLRRLADELLEPIRFRLGVPVEVTVAYRSPQLNAAVGGVSTSAHLNGCAADLFPLDGMSIPDAFDIIRMSDLPYDQVINEQSCIHVAIAAPGQQPRRQAMVRYGVRPAWTYEVVS